MKTNAKMVLRGISIAMALLIGTNAHAQSCCSKEKTPPAAQSTPGCKPSACRGAKTKYGEAKVITNLRESLIDVKAEMEQSSKPKFSARSYDIHDILGESDDESLKIIIREVKIMEKELKTKVSYNAGSFELPSSKAKQIQYLQTRIERMKKKV